MAYCLYFLLIFYTGTYTNEIERQVRIKFSKFGGTSASPSNLNQLWFIDDVSLNFASGLGEKGNTRVFYILL